MDKISRLFETIKAIRKFNSYCKDILPDTESLPYYILENFSKPIEKMEWLADFEPDLFFLEITCTISSQSAYENTIQAFFNELKEYIDWFNANRERVIKLTDFGAIYNAVHIILPHIKTGLELEEAKKKTEIARTDRHIHHMLARAYGAISEHESQYHELKKEDKEYIDRALEDYKKHFNVTSVDLPKMYEDFHNKSYMEFKEIEKQLSEAYKRNEEDRHRLMSQIKKDMHQYVATLLWPYLENLQKSKDSTVGENNSNETKGLPGRRPLGVFDSLEDMFNNYDHFMTIDKYIRTKGTINSSEAKSIFAAINRPEVGILKDRVSMEHFGTLVIKQYGLLCSFTSGKSVADGKTFNDIESTVRALLGITETTQTK